MTALAMAARGNAPVVVFAGDAPIGASWYVQSIDQAPLALAAFCADPHD
jgi:thiamine pyrophosphate-dependent acetolactate synthase large subunit-like protein